MIVDSIINKLSWLLLSTDREKRALITLKNKLLYGERVYNFKHLGDYTK